MSRYTDYANAAAQPVNVAAAVSRYLANEVALRRLALSRPTRNVGATERAIAWRLDDRTVIEGSLVFADRLVLVGLLTEHRKLSERLAEAKRAHQDRPELRTRLAAVRKAIKKEIG